MRTLAKATILPFFLAALMVAGVGVGTVPAEETPPAPTGVSAVAVESPGVVDLSWTVR